jgi:hypothetical protein
VNREIDSIPHAIVKIKVTRSTAEVSVLMADHDDSQTRNIDTSAILHDRCRRLLGGNYPGRADR